VRFAQCEKFFLAHSNLRRVSNGRHTAQVREVISRATIVRGYRRAPRASIYGGTILAETFTIIPKTHSASFARPSAQAAPLASPEANKMSIALRLAHNPARSSAALEPFSRHGVNSKKSKAAPSTGGRRISVLSRR